MFEIFSENSLKAKGILRCWNCVQTKAQTKLKYRFLKNSEGCDFDELNVIEEIKN